MLIQNIKFKRFVLSQYNVLSRSICFLGGKPVLVVSLPKAGTHLVTAILGCFPKVMLTHQHLRVPDFHDATIPYANPQDFRPNAAKLRKALSRIQPGQVASCHFPYSLLADEVIREAGLRVLFVVRDPRDIAISQVNYITKLVRHPLHRMLLENYEAFDERLLACIRGIEGIDQLRTRHHLTFIDRDLPSLTTRASAFSGWLRSPDALTIRFEDLVGSRGGGDDGRKREVIEAMANHIDKPLTASQIDKLMIRSADAKSATFMSGKAYAWRKSLTPDMAAAVTREIRQILDIYGYPA